MDSEGGARADDGEVDVEVQDLLGVSGGRGEGEREGEETEEEESTGGGESGEGGACE